MNAIHFQAQLLLANIYFTSSMSVIWKEITVLRHHTVNNWQLMGIWIPHYFYDLLKKNQQPQQQQQTKTWERTAISWNFYLGITCLLFSRNGNFFPNSKIITIISKVESHDCALTSIYTHFSTSAILLLLICLPK